MVSKVALKTKYPRLSELRRSGTSTWVFADDDLYRMVWNTEELMSWRISVTPDSSSAEIFFTQNGWWVQAAQYRIAQCINDIAVQDMNVHFETYNKKRFVHIDGKRYEYQDGMIVKVERSRAVGAKTIVTHCSTPEIPKVKYRRKPTISRW